MEAGRPLVCCEGRRASRGSLAGGGGLSRSLVVEPRSRRDWACWAWRKRAASRSTLLGGKMSSAGERGPPVELENEGGLLLPAEEARCPFVFVALLEPFSFWL